ncbi:MAG: molybdate ABC transporter substrate-binding protein [Gemmatimonadales bacterium]
MNGVAWIALAALGLHAPAAQRPLTLAAHGPPTLTIYAAASLAEAFRELGRVLEARRPGLSVRFNFAGSQQLALQIEQGAPADVFASADERWMRIVDEQRLLAGDAAIFARNRLVVIVPRANPARISQLTDLVRKGTKLVVAAEAVPAGRYSRAVLRRLADAPGFPDGYDRRVLANVVSEEENVKAVVAKVQLGEADAGLVYRSDVTPAVARDVRVLEIPDPYNEIARYPIAVLARAGNAEDARRFVELVSSDAGQRILWAHGLLPAGSTAPAVARP